MDKQIQVIRIDHNFQLPQSCIIRKETYQENYQDTGDGTKLEL